MATQFITYSPFPTYTIYPTLVSFPASAFDGSLAMATDTDTLYVFDAGTVDWLALGAPSVAFSIGAIDGGVASVNGVSIDLGVLYMQSASDTVPGLVNNSAQVLSGDKSFDGETTIGEAAGTSIHQINGGLQVTTRSTASSITVDTTTTDCVVFVDCSGGAKTITLPPPSDGRLLVIKDSTGSAGVNSITVSPNAAELIDGEVSQAIDAAWGYLRITSDGTDWFLV